MFTFKEYLEDFASPELREKGTALIKEMLKTVEHQNLIPKIEDNLNKITKGERDLYF